MVEQTDNGSLSGGAHFFGVVCSFTVGGALVLVLREPGYDLDGHLRRVSIVVVVQLLILFRFEGGMQALLRGVRTCSPVSRCFASLTLPMLPAPIVFPSVHVPVLGAVMVVLRFVLAGCAAATPLAGMADTVDASDAYRAWLLLLDSVRAGAGAGRSLDSLRRTPSFATLVCSQSRAATLLRPCCWRACEWVLGRDVVLCERWGRSAGLA